MAVVDPFGRINFFLYACHFCSLIHLYGIYIFTDSFILNIFSNVTSFPSCILHCLSLSQCSHQSISLYLYLKFSYFTESFDNLIYWLIFIPGQALCNVFGSNLNIHPSVFCFTVVSIVSLQLFIQYFTDAVSKVLENLCLFGRLKR